MTSLKPKNMPTKNKKTYTYAVGRRRSAVATIKLFSGTGPSTINKIALNKYFPGKFAAITYQQPFLITKTQKKYYFQARTSGGGKKGQLEALALAISRALVKIDDTHKKILRPAGLITVDSRIRQRRMVGTGGKARRKKQSPRR